jgi:putative FmdB family regulatory protein
MPLYEFRCPNGHEFEKFYRSIGTSSSEAECPICGAVGARVMSTAGLVFKGSGFYITDYGKDGKKAEREAVTAEKNKADTAAAAKTGETKSSDAGTTSAEPASKEKVSATSESSSMTPAASKPAPTKPPEKPAPKSKTSE